MRHYGTPGIAAGVQGCIHGASRAASGVSGAVSGVSGAASWGVRGSVGELVGVWVRIWEALLDSGSLWVTCPVELGIHFASKNPQGMLNSKKCSEISIDIDLSAVSWDGVEMPSETFNVHFLGFHVHCLRR